MNGSGKSDRCVVPKAEVLNAIYEAGFKDFSYGFRPGRSLVR